LTWRREWHSWSYCTEFLQLFQGKQTTANQELPCRGRLVRTSIVVISDYVIDVGCVDSTIEAIHVRSRNRVLHSTVTREIGTKNLTGTQVGIRHYQ
jgi:hypothetical protein